MWLNHTPLSKEMWAKNLQIAISSLPSYPEKVVFDALELRFQEHHSSARVAMLRRESEFYEFYSKRTSNMVVYDGIFHHILFLMEIKVNTFMSFLSF